MIGGGFEQRLCKVMSWVLCSALAVALLCGAAALVKLTLDYVLK